ncbi:MAG: sensor histidine kinase [Bacteroidetes bacterium]|nr:MAG: sensor histidine kinase [Bacteroidota bacterium]
MKNSTIIRVVLFGAIAIMGILATQAYLLINTWDEKEQEFHEKVVIALQNVAKEFEKLGSPLPAYDLINKVSSNYYVVNVNDIINANNLQYFLRRELEAVGLTEDFEYGIHDCETRQMVYGNYISYSARLDSSLIQKEELPIYDKYTYYFGVRFPKRTGHILSSMRLTIIFSVILFVTILFFLYSMWVILRQKRLSEMQKDFINNMTHEFKTPISTIKISADVFLGHPAVQQDPRLRQYAHIIRDQNQRLNNQVEKVLQLAKIEKDNFRLNREPVQLHPLLEGIVQSCKLKAEEKGGRLRSELLAQDPVVSADKLHLSNILHNLLDNALKYCREAPDILVRTRRQGSALLLEVRDHGIGIPREYQARVFEKFYRVPTGNLHDVKGFGLGLYYVRNVCEAHGWKISLQSEPGKGTTVTILMNHTT